MLGDGTALKPDEWTILKFFETDAEKLWFAVTRQNLLILGFFPILLLFLEGPTVWCLLIHDKYIKYILSGQKVWEIRTQRLFSEGERIALGNTKSKLVEGFATVSEVKKMTVPEMKKYNDKHFANDFITERWSDREWLYAFVLSNVTGNPTPLPYPLSHGNPRVRLNEFPIVQKT